MLRLGFWSALGMLILVGIPAHALDVGQNAAIDRKLVAGAPGRIEGSEEPISIGASITGIVEEVAVHQGDLVSKGDLLVRIDCSDIKAQLAARTAEYTAAKALYRKLVNGPRPEEIKIAEADLELAKARLAEARARKTRSFTLLNSNAGNRATADVDDRDVGMAEAQLESARLRLQLLKVGTREEDLAEAEAKMSAAGHTVDATMAELAKYEVRSPINGIVLRKEVSEGELVSVFYPKPLLTLSEIGKYRVKAEVDEHDIAKLKLGQRAVIAVNALGQSDYGGTWPKSR